MSHILPQNGIQSVFCQRSIFLTGHTDFKWSWLAAWLKLIGADITGVALDQLSQPSHFEVGGLAKVLEDHRLDIRDELSKLQQLGEEFSQIEDKLNQTDVSAYDRGVIGYYLHNFYNGCKGIFRVVGRFFENNLVPQSWHSHLLTRSALEVLRNAHQPTDRMVEVEALRYLHFGKFKSPKVDHRLTANKPPLKLLILGDIQRNATDSMLQILESSSEYFRKVWELQFKPHPATPVSIADYPDLKLTITNAHLEQLLPQFHTVIVSITTSDAIEAYVTDLPVISIVDGQNLNLSLLRGMKDAFFVSSADELRQTLDQIRVHSPIINNSDDIFWTDPDLPRWKALLGQVERPTIKKCLHKFMQKSHCFESTR